MSISTIKQQQKAKKVSFPPFFPLLHGRTENLIWIVASASSLAWKTDSNSKKKSEGEKEIEEDQHNRTFPATAIPRNPFTEKIPIRRGKKGKSPMPAVPRSSRKSNVLQESAKYFFSSFHWETALWSWQADSKKKRILPPKKTVTCKHFFGYFLREKSPEKNLPSFLVGIWHSYRWRNGRIFPFQNSLAAIDVWGKEMAFFPQPSIQPTQTSGVPSISRPKMELKAPWKENGLWKGLRRLEGFHPAFLEATLSSWKAIGGRRGGKKNDCGREGWKKVSDKTGFGGWNPRWKWLAITPCS